MIFLIFEQITQLMHRPVLSQVAQSSLQSIIHEVGFTEQVAHRVLSQGSHEPSVWVNYPNGQDVHNPVASHVVQSLLQGKVQLILEFIHLAHLVSSQGEH